MPARPPTDPLRCCSLHTRRHVCANSHRSQSRSRAPHAPTPPRALCPSPCASCAVARGVQAFSCQAAHYNYPQPSAPHGRRARRPHGRPARASLRAAMRVIDVAATTPINAGRCSTATLTSSVRMHDATMSGANACLTRSGAPARSRRLIGHESRRWPRPIGITGRPTR